MAEPTLRVCEHCLMAIESREGHQPTLRHDIELEYDDEQFAKCQNAIGVRKTDLIHYLN